MVSLMTVFLGLTVAYIAFVLWIAHKGSERFQLIGPLLMVRTQAGKKLIDKVARRKWWGPVGDVFLVLTVLSGLLMVLLVVWQNTLLFTHTALVAERPPRVSETLAIPGVNPVIPVWYGLLSLIVALVIHEGGHGILARFAQLKVKSLGLLFLVIPIGAFVEPDEHALQRTSLRNKLRMFAAGPGPNIVLALLCVLLFAQVMVPALAPSHDGVALLGVNEGLPAGDAGLQAGMFITSINGTETRDLEGFSAALNTTRPNQTIPVTATTEDGEATFQVTPMSRYDYLEERAPDLNNETNRNRSFLGVNPAGPDELDGLMNQFVHPFEEQGLTRGSLFYLALPFVNLQPFPDAFHDIWEPTGIFADWGVAFWITANSLYWLFWLNIVLGTFNALPLGPLDGGHMFRHSLHAYWRKRAGIRDRDLEVLDHEDEAPKYTARNPEVQDRLDKVDRRVSLANSVVGWGLLALVLAPLIVPQFL